MELLLAPLVILLGAAIDCFALLAVCAAFAAVMAGGTRVLDRLLLTERSVPAPARPSSSPRS